MHPFLVEINSYEITPLLVLFGETLIKNHHRKRISEMITEARETTPARGPPPSIRRLGENAVDKSYGNRTTQILFDNFHSVQKFSLLLMIKISI